MSNKDNQFKDNLSDYLCGKFEFVWFSEHGDENMYENDGLFVELIGVLK